MKQTEVVAAIIRKGDRIFATQREVATCGCGSGGSNKIKNTVAEYDRHRTYNRHGTML